MEFHAITQPTRAAAQDPDPALASLYDLASTITPVGVVVLFIVILIEIKCRSQNSSLGNVFSRLT